MSIRTNAEKTAAVIWERTGRELPKWGDDAALVELVEQARDNCEIAIAGLILVLGGGCRNASARYGWAIEHEATTLDGFGAAMSMLYLAVHAYDTTTHTSGVGNRLAADVQYMASRPAKYGDAKRATLFTGHETLEGHEWNTAAQIPQDDEGYSDIEAALFVDQALSGEDVPARWREVGVASFVHGLTDREAALELGIPYGSVARVRNNAREVVAKELVA